MYVPSQVGESLPIVYFPEEPERGYGPAYFRDRTFLVFVPWFLAIIGVYSIARLVDKAFNYRVS